MRRRPPPFALVLSSLVAGAGIAVVLLTGSASSGGRTNTIPTIGLGPSRVCVRARAEAQVTARSAIVITATAKAPVKVTERASGPNGTVAVTRSDVATARLRVDQPLSVRHVAGVQAGACANAHSSTAARDAALRQAYATALASAHATAARTAEASLWKLVQRQYPSVASQAQAKASARARRLALTQLSALAAQARAEADRRAGA